MKQLLKRIVVMGAIALLLVPTIASAHPGHDHGDEKPTSGGGSTGSPAPQDKAPDQLPRDEKRKLIDQKLQDMKQQRQDVVADMKAEGRQKLDATKKKICEKHESKVNKLINSMNVRREKAYDRITQVYEAVQDYHSTHNLSVANYDDLILTAEAAKAAALEAKDAQHAAPKLKCGGEQPKADVVDFKLKRADSIDALKQYRESVKAVVKAVKEAANDTKENA